MSDLATQQELFPKGALPEGAELLMSDEQQRDLYPLTTVERNRERLQSVIFLLGRNAPKQFICESLGIGWHTLQSIAQKHGEKIADIKKRTAAKAALFVELGIDQLIEDLQEKKLRGDKLAFAWKQVAEVMQLLTGEATSIVGTTDSGPRLTADTLRERLANMKRADVIDLPTGSAVENLSPIAAGAPGAEPAAPGSDSQSVKP
jgi:hypothetical protein